MAIIYSYPPNSNILPTDILVCTSTVLVGGRPKNQTKSVSIQNLTSYINTSSTNNLDQVLTNGNISLLDAKIGELYLYDITEQEYGKVILYDSQFNFYNNLGTIIAAIAREGIVFFPNAYNAQILATTITGSRQYQLPDQSGTIALTSNLSAYVPYTGATQAVNLGAFNLLANGVSIGKGTGSGIANVAIGQSALGLATTGDQNVAVGTNSLSKNTTGGNNTAVGRNSMEANVSGGGNTSIGNFNLSRNTNGVGNTAAGNYCMSGNTTGSYNTAMGNVALAGNTTASNNSAFGWGTLGVNTTGANNTAVGAGALAFNTIGIENTGVGRAALYNNTTGNYNTAVGLYSLVFNTIGINNTAIGLSSGAYIANKTSNASILNDSVMLGTLTSPLANNQTNQIVIGYNATGAGSDTVTIGNTSITTTRLRGTIQGGSFVKDGGTSSQYLMADGSVTTVPYKYNFAGSTSLTGTLTTTNLLTITIPADSLTDYLDLRSIMVQQSGPALAGITVRVWHNSVNNFNTATRIANYAFGVGGADLFAQMTRRFSLQSGLLFGFPAVGSNIAGEGSTANAALSIPFNPATINYLFVSIQLNNVLDTATLRNVNITT